MDGGSTDNSIQIAQSFADRDSRIKVISRPDRGMYDAVLSGFQEMDGDICFWINSDDIILPWALQCVDKFSTRFRVDWITALPTLLDADGALWSVLAMWRYSYSQSLIRKGWYNPAALGSIQQESTFFSRKLLNSLSREQIEAVRNCKLAGDFVLWKSMAEQSQLSVMPTVIGGFRKHPGNMSGDLTKYIEEAKHHGAVVPSRILSPVVKLLNPLVYLATCRSNYSRRWRQALNLS